MPKGFKGFQKGHKTNVGRKHSPETRRKITLSRLGEKNPNWKANNIRYHDLHYRIKQKLPKPELCDVCKNDTPYDLANVSGKYLHSVHDWQWLCRKCHMLSDGRLINLRHSHETQSEISKKGWERFSPEQRHDRAMHVVRLRTMRRFLAKNNT